MVKTTVENYINHIAFLIDASTSMLSREQQVVQVVDRQVEHLAKRSKELNQEVRVSIYFFAGRDSVRCVIYDKDVLRLPSIQGLYKARGQTALRDAQLKVIDDLRRTPELYGDHSYLLLTVTDGGENDSITSELSLRNAIESIPQQNWSLGALVPDQRCAFEAKKAGFPAGNVAVWDTSRSFDEVGNIFTEVTDAYMTGRTRGIRSTKSLFHKVDVKVNAIDVAQSLVSLKSYEYTLVNINRVEEIRPLVEAVTQKSYVTSSGYYQLTKTEDVQPRKKIAIRNNQTGQVYVGANARQLLGIPSGSVKLKPGDFGQFTIFIESTSINRKLLPGTQLLVLATEVVETLKAEQTRSAAYQQV